MKSSLKNTLDLKPGMHGSRERLERFDDLPEQDNLGEQPSGDIDRNAIKDFLPQELQEVFAATLDADTKKMKLRTKELKGRTDIEHWSLVLEIMWRAQMLVEKNDGKVSRVNKIRDLLHDLESMNPEQYHLDEFVSAVQEFIFKKKNPGK